ncbi:MAG: hypothetical protein M3R05_00085 [Chloroflexota bacterium]|nr:hypothetical protein [Chloroflexota bacterium]
MPLTRLLALPVLALAVLAFPSLVAAAPPIRVQNDRAANSRTVPDGTTPGGTVLVRSTGARIGYDISYPQCGSAYPRNPAFGIVGVNGGIVFSGNRCLASQLVWAGTNAQLYANTGNPGPQLSTHWPTGQSTPRACSSSNPDSLDCAYDYGWNAAADSYRKAVDAYVSLGQAPQGAIRTPTANTWWLDVETGNSWRTDGARNVAVLQGAVAYLESVEVGGVGFYSTSYQWGQITGGSRAFATYPSWHAGAQTLRTAKRYCSGSGFTGGRIVLTQYIASGFDADYRC